MCARVLDHFIAPPRQTSLPYDEWFTGQRLLLERNVDFNDDPRNVATKILNYARRRNMAAVAIPMRDPDDRSPKAPLRAVQVWGDPTRTWEQGPPADLVAELRSVGVRLRRRTASGADA